jgi:hypothetical protein
MNRDVILVLAFLLVLYESRTVILEFLRTVAGLVKNRPAFLVFVAIITMAVTTAIFCFGLHEIAQSLLGFFYFSLFLLLLEISCTLCHQMEVPSPSIREVLCRSTD